MPYAKNGDINIYYETHGERGPALVFAHGAAVLETSRIRAVLLANALGTASGFVCSCTSVQIEPAKGCRLPNEAGSGVVSTKAAATDSAARARWKRRPIRKLC